MATVTYWAAKGPRHQGLAVPLNTCDPKEVTMVWVLLLSMAMPNGGVAIEKFAYYSTEGVRIVFFDPCVQIGLQLVD